MHFKSIIPIVWRRSQYILNYLLSSQLGQTLVQLWITFIATWLSLLCLFRCIRNQYFFLCSHIYNVDQWSITSRLETIMLLIKIYLKHNIFIMIYLIPGGSLDLHMSHGLSLLEMHSGGNDQRPRCRPTFLGVLGARWPNTYLLLGRAPLGGTNRWWSLLRSTLTLVGG